MPMYRLGIIGGTFNPLHNGHIRMAELAMDAAGLSEVRFIPTGISPHKPTLLSGGHRLEMVRLAIDGHTGFTASDIELKRSGKSFTYQTLEEISAESPDAELYFIMGADMMESFTSWRRADYIARLARLIAVPRPGEDMDRLNAAIRQAQTALSAVITVTAEPGPEISSTEIRRRVLNELDIGGLVPPPVVDYIRDHQLYSKEDDAL